MAERIRRHPKDLPKRMQKALRDLEVDSTDENGRVFFIEEVIFVGRREPDETAVELAAKESR